MSSSNNNGDDMSCSSGPHVSVEDELSTHVLAALLEFQQSAGFPFDAVTVIPPASSSSSTQGTMASPTAIPASSGVGVINETYRRLEQQEAESTAREEDVIRTTCHQDDLLQILYSDDEYGEIKYNYGEFDVVDQLQTQGVVRINGVLNDTLCDGCLDYINHARSQSSPDDNNPLAGFGNVSSRTNRCDMYLHNDGICEKALEHMLHQDAALGGLFATLLDGKAGLFHEFSSLISDVGSKSQPIHPDSCFSEHAPLWTVFVALQNVHTTMGPTVFLPCTNTRLCHQQLESKQSKRTLLEASQYRRSVLNKGDCAVMDSRLFHFGDANVSQDRRVLMYFSIRNPLHDGEYPKGGSLFEGTNITTWDFL